MEGQGPRPQALSWDGALGSSVQLQESATSRVCDLCSCPGPCACLALDATWKFEEVFFFTPLQGLPIFILL